MQNKWAPLVMRLLSEGAQPFSELRRALPRTSPKELTRALRSLVRDGFITHDAGADSPGYSLTPLGQSLLTVLLDVYAWTAEHWDEVVDARERADRAGTGSPVTNVLTRDTWMVAFKASSVHTRKGSPSPVRKPFVRSPVSSTTRTGPRSPRCSTT
ncbi:winged helix-turn-helix transcriptional regulator [Streptomyces lincolnensis]|uniref:winged helix-turn-helix transcriptional regulator n=1 Tax=Streptomyces lincolnensis TaxID=1915 RepID=UPI0022B26A6B|nr:helix-turn-helix domain-containing protein [Streptomyces lincolnensis]